MKLLQLVAVMEQAQQLESKGEIIAAINFYQEWLAAENSDEAHLRYVAFYNMGRLLRLLGQLAQSVTAYESALQLKPDFYQAAVNLGLAHEVMGDTQKALDVWNRALQPIEAQTLLLNHSGRVFENTRRYDQAEQLLKRSLMINPEQPDVIQHYLHIRQKICCWPILEPVAGASEQYMLENCGPLGILALTDDPAVQLSVISSWVERKIPRNLPRLSPLAGYRHDKIRIGYLSGDFCWHAVSILTAELFELHDRQRFEINAFDYSIDDGSAFRQRVLQAMDVHLPIHDLSDQQAAQLIRDREIDVLIDLTGLTSGARPAILAYKPAPIQISYLGFVGTLGMQEIDYILADRFVFPETLAQHFVEKPLYLPDVYQVNDTQRAIGETPSRASCGLPEDSFVYCSFNGSYKISPDVFSVWMRILSRVPKSVLWLVADNETAKAQLRYNAEKQGIDPDRLIFAEKVAPMEYLARYRVADLLLDTSPYNAGTTASDALWADLPVLTCPGNTFASRMAGSLLQAVGLTELIMPNWHAYEERAVLLAQQPQRIADYKTYLRTHKLDTPLFDSKRFVLGLERALLDICQQLTDSSPNTKGNPIIEIVSATLKTPDEFWNQSALGLSLKRLQQDKRLIAHIQYQNRLGLPEIYNRRIVSDDAADILVFVHDDVWIDDYFLVDRIIEGLQRFDVIGVAGNVRRQPYQPGWAFVQTDAGMKVDAEENFSGSVAHGEEAFGKINFYGATPAECELLDGLFLAASKSALRQNDVAFDPRFNFHFYDMDFCRSAKDLGLKIGTWPICLTHKSGGAFESKDWESGRMLYFDKWGS